MLFGQAALSTDRHASRPTVTVALTTIVLVVASSGCAEAGSDNRAWSGSLLDSAGITIVRNEGPDLLDDGAWRTGEPAILAAGGAGEEVEFGHVADLAVGSDGRIFVLDQQARSVRVLSPDGALLMTLGGPGEGPGEFSRFASSILIVKDTVIVTDWAQARVSRFTQSGTFLDDLPFPGQPGVRSWWATEGPDGPIYFRSLERWVDDDERWRGTDALFRWVPGHEPQEVLRFEYPESNLGGPGAARVPLLVNAPSWAPMSDGTIYWTSMDRSELRVHRPGEGLVRLVRRPAWTNAPIDDRAHASLVDLLRDKFEMLGSDADLVDQLDVLRDRALPAVTALFPGPGGTLWVQRMGDPSDVHPMAINAPDHPDWFGGPLWDVLDATGRYQATVELPPRLRLLDSDGEAVYGVLRDELDVERVVRIPALR